MGGLAATSPTLVWYSQEGRAYSLVVLLSSASFLFFARALARPASRELALWATASILALATHYFAVFVVAPDLIILVGLHLRARRVYAAAGAVVLCGAALLPLAVVQTTHNRFAWIGHIPLSRRSGDTLRRLLIASEPSSWWGATGVEYRAYLWIPALALALVLAATILLVVHGDRAEQRAGAIPVVVALAAFGSSVVLAYAADRVTGRRGDSFLDRNMLSAWLPLNLFVAIGLAVRHARYYGLALASTTCLAAVAVTILIAAEPSLQRDDWRSAARTVEGPRQAVLVYPAYQAAALLEQRRALAEFPARGAPIDRIVLLLPGFQHPPDSSRVPRHFVDDGVERVQNFTVFRFRASHIHRLFARNLLNVPLEQSDMRIFISPPERR